MPAEDYQFILNYEIPEEQFDYYPVYTIRSAKESRDNKLKNELYEWDKLTALGEMNP